MLQTFIFGIISAFLFLMIQNIIIYDIYGLEYKFLDNLRPLQERLEVQNTSRLVSAWRAIDSSRKNSVYYDQDPLAEVLSGPDMIESVKKEMIEVYRAQEDNEIHPVTLRQLAINNRIMNYTSKDIKQVVVIGAGLDTRPYRLVLPEVKWFEIDMPEVISMKERILQEENPTLTVKSLTRIAMNLGTSSNLSHDLKYELSSHGHKSSEPTLYLVEGLLMYLSPSVVKNLMSSIVPTAGAQSRIIATQIAFFVHYLLTNPLVVYIIEKMSKSKSHRMGFLFKSNLKTTDLGPNWLIENVSNIGKEMYTKQGLMQWQDINHEPGSPPKFSNTAESIIDAVLVR